MNPSELPDKSNLQQYMTPKKAIHWDKNGIPQPYTNWILPKSRIDDILLAALALPFSNPDDDPELEGLTNIEAAAIQQAKKAAKGDLEATKFVIERLIGKPKQQIEQTTLTMTLKDYLATLDIGNIVDTTTEDWDM